MEQKEVLVLCNRFLQQGGLEENIMRWIEEYGPQGVRILWITYEKRDVFSEWVPILEKYQVEIKQLSDCEDLKLENARVRVLTFFPIDYALMRYLFPVPSSAEVHWFYMVPNVNSVSYNFLEFFTNKTEMKAFRKALLEPVYQRMNEAGQLLYFAQEHITSMEESYALEAIEPKERILVRSNPKIVFDEAFARKRSRSRDTDFRIISCGRFQFPYKGYMLGLVREYAALKPQYPQLKLELIGYGLDEKRLYDLIDSYPPEITADITLHGAVHYDSLQTYFDQCHLCLGTGGSIRDAAISAIPSLPTVDDTEECLVGGFFAGDQSIWVSFPPPHPVRGFILEAMEATEEEYVSLCRGAYDTFASEYTGENNNWLLNQRNTRDFDYPQLDQDMNTLFCCNFSCFAPPDLFEVSPSSDSMILSAEFPKENFQNLVKQINEEHTEVFFYGAGWRGGLSLLLHGKLLGLKGFIDRNYMEFTDGFLGLPVYSPDMLKEKHPLIVVTSDSYQRILEDLGQYGYVYRKDCIMFKETAVLLFAAGKLG